jgi:soluble cytochrome b562
LLAVIAFSGAGLFSLALLLKLPALPNCPSIFWPTASASLRLYCAELAANKQTVSDLLTAIALVNSLPEDHPLRPEINSNIEKWSLAILELAEQEFQGGDIDEAIEMVKKIPTNTTAHQQIEEQIKRWQEIWAEAEQIYAAAEQAMIDQDLQVAFSTATRLLSVGNEYWATTKYQELTDLITASREDGNKLANANRLARRGGLSNLLEAIKLAKEIRPNSPAYAVAQRLIGEFGKKMFDLAEATLEAGDSERAISIARQIPEQAQLQADVQDFINLAMAEAQAWGGTVSDLEAAIIQAQRLGRDRPLYDRAQTLIRRWQLEIQDVNHIELARQIAANGGVENLAAAIAEAQSVPSSNPRYDEARDLINRWTSQIQTIEDQPYLEQAEALAQAGTVSALQAAINQASQIREGRALYSEAQQQIRDWTSRIQRIQDQPYLDEARRLANAGNLPAAIATAEQIQSGRALYDDAQADIRTWRTQTEGRNRLQSAYDLATVATPSNLLSAIQTANQIPRNSPARAEADQMINLWSQQLLAIAQQQSERDLQSAIAIASSIPPRTEAYAAAQLQIQTWQQSQTGTGEEGLGSGVRGQGSGVR